MLATALELEGRTVVRVREPGGTPIGERIRALLLELPAELAAARRGDTPDRIESESDGFHAAVAEGFAAAAARFPERIRVVDASGPPRAVLARVREAANL